MKIKLNFLEGQLRARYFHKILRPRCKKQFAASLLTPPPIYSNTTITLRFFKKYIRKQRTREPEPAVNRFFFLLLFVSTSGIVNFPLPDGCRKFPMVFALIHLQNASSFATSTKRSGDHQQCKFTVINVFFFLFFY